MRIADYLMECLSKAGVKTIFTVTGRGSLFLTDALAKHEEMQHVCVHHEQSASFAAIANSEQTNNLGVCLVSTGCASTNAITGVLSAWQDQIPVVFISGQNYLQETTRHTGAKLRTYGQQEADIISIIEPITKYAHMLSSKDEAVDIINKAIVTAISGRKGPVWLDIPLDLQSAHIEVDTIPQLTADTAILPKAKNGETTKTINALNNAKRPLILIGSGVHGSGATHAFKEFAESWNIPVVFSASATDVYGSSNPLSIGSVGAMGCSRAGNFAVQNCDMLLVLGNRLTSLTTGTDYCKFARDAEIHVVDIDVEEHRKDAIRIDQLIHSDVKYFIDELTKFDSPNVPKGWVSKCQHWKNIFAKAGPKFTDENTIDLYDLADALSEAVPPSATLITDSGLNEVIIPTNFRFSDGINCIHPASQGTMGFALPAAVGASFETNKMVLTIVGDGSIMMNLQELETIRHHQLPVKIFVVNNNVYSIIRRRQKDLFRKRIIGTDPDNGVSTPSFSEVAACFGLTYKSIEAPQDLSAQIKEVLKTDGPVLCEINGRDDQGYIEVGHARSEEAGRFVRRPLEDQSPFLDRELFLSEMIIDPIDQ